MAYTIDREQYDELLEKHRHNLVLEKTTQVTRLCVELGTELDNLSVLYHHDNRGWFHETDMSVGTIVQDLIRMAQNEVCEPSGLLD